MEYESWDNDWLTELKKKVRYFRAMIKNTRHETCVQYLASTRDRLTQALKGKCDLNSPSSVLEWAAEIMRQVEAARGELDQVIRSSELELPHTREAYRHAGNLVTEISNGISKFKKTLTERK